MKTPPSLTVAEAWSQLDQCLAAVSRQLARTANGVPPSETLAMTLDAELCCCCEAMSRAVEREIEFRREVVRTCQSIISKLESSVTPDPQAETKPPQSCLDMPSLAAAVCGMTTPKP